MEYIFSRFRFDFSTDIDAVVACAVKANAKIDIPTINFFIINSFILIFILLKHIVARATVLT